MKENKKPKPRKAVVYVVPEGAETARLDKMLRNAFPDWGRQAVGRVIQNRQVQVNGKSVWMSSWKVHAGDEIEINDPPASRPQAPKQFDPDWLVADEGDLLVVNKPAGLRSQTTRAGGEDNLLSLVQAAFGENLHLFHRLDRDTSGLCILTRPGPVNAYLDEAFKGREVVKSYVGLVSTRGSLEDSGVLRDYLDRDPKRRDKMVIVKKGGKVAFTDYLIESEELEGIRVSMQPQTGRTHQLRVQLAERGAPIIGDILYGGETAERLMLHAWRIALPEMGDFQARVWESAAEF